MHEGQHNLALVVHILDSFHNGSMQGHANVHLLINTNNTAIPLSHIRLCAEHQQRCAYSTTAATAAKAPAAPIPIAGPICIAAPLACVEAPVVLPVCVCVPLFEFAEPVGVVEPPLAVPVVDAVVDVGVDAVLPTEPAVITTGSWGISETGRVAVVREAKELWEKKPPVASSVHTATELPEITQLTDKVLRSCQSRRRPATGR